MPAACVRTKPFQQVKPLMSLFRSAGGARSTSRGLARGSLRRRRRQGRRARNGGESNRRRLGRRREIRDRAGGCCRAVQRGLAGRMLARELAVFNPRGAGFFSEFIISVGNVWGAWVVLS